MIQAKRIVGVLLAMVLVLSVLAACGTEDSQGSPNKKYVLKFNHVLSESEPFHQGFLNWAERVKERTNGGLEIQVFPSAQLGVEEDIIEQLKQGVNVGQNTDSARLGMYVPDIAVMNAPYFVNSIEEVEKLNELPSVKKWMEELENKHGIKVLSFNWVQGFRHMVTNKPIRTPQDLKGLRIRTPGVPIWQESVRALGASPVALPFGEVYVGLQQGAIDGAELVYRNVTGGKLYEASKYISETKHILLINFEVISKKFFDSLPKEYQDILVEEANKAGLETSRIMEQEAEQIKQELIGKGMTIVSDVDIEAFKKAGEAAYEKLNLTEVRDRIYKEMGKTP
ncbi:C4-dicarboxylate TRAP transporter substrate-binding protein [Paenibacillus thermoaerophilus]|uniref:C4-dicarboxylate TRAP transporter substrate-binding protein n=1 Tax=Paenibacillus thermoaerophilus TaxID=1215385 RepID=A0ABW2V5L3_9BACL|nr:C4-dicarboxylate TRAP transporter substrate-binding protein [Paenibacillus thermoaerophilus]TMV17189.1 DctP family TRAP transporter solute-binding subunit [Paenibacillus thermoaerophilus]